MSGEAAFAHLKALGRELNIDLMRSVSLEGKELLFRDDNREWLQEQGYCSAISLAMEISQTTMELLSRHTDEGLIYYASMHIQGQAAALESAAQRLALEIDRMGHRAFVIPGRGRAYKKSKPIGVTSHIAIARLAGMGELGDNGLILSPEFGPRMRLSAILTSLPLPDSQPVSPGLCRHCGLCSQICPAQAVCGASFDPEQPTEQFIHKDVCAVYRDKRDKEFGNRFCNLCMAVCPVGRHSMS